MTFWENLFVLPFHTQTYFFTIVLHFIFSIFFILICFLNLSNDKMQYYQISNLLMRELIR